MRTILFALIVLCARPALADDMHKYLTETQDLIRQGKHQQALERCLWFHEHALEHQPSMSAVRLSFALSYWKELGDKYPPAKKAMIGIRDRDTKRLLAGQGNAELFHDVKSINGYLKEDNKTITLFRALDKTRPELAREAWWMAKDMVLAAKEYELAHTYIGDPVKAFDRHKEVYDEEMRTRGDPINLLFYHPRSKLVGESLRLIKYAIGINNVKSAKLIQERALAISDDQRLRDAIPEQTEAGAKK